MTLAIVLGVLAGMSIVLGRMVNARLSGRINPYRATFYNYVTGLALSALLLLFASEAAPVLFALKTARDVLMVTGGFLGVAVVVLSNIVTPRMSAFLLTLIVFISQLGAAIAIDALLGMPVSAGKAIGGVLVLLGLVYNQNLERKIKREKNAG